MSGGKQRNEKGRKASGPEGGPELHDPAESGSLPTCSESSIAALGNGCAPWNFAATTCCLPLSSIMKAPKKPSLCMRNSEVRPSYSLISALCPGMSGSRLGMGSQSRLETCRSLQSFPSFPEVHQYRSPRKHDQSSPLP